MYARVLQHTPERYRKAYYACFYDVDLEIAAAALRVLGAMLLSRSADPEVLDAVGMCVVLLWGVCVVRVR